MGGREGEQSCQDGIDGPRVRGGNGFEQQGDDAGQHPDLAEDAEVGALVEFLGGVGHDHHLGARWVVSFVGLGFGGLGLRTLMVVRT